VRILLDTHVLLWALAEPERLEGPVRLMIEDSANEMLFSAASIWEIAIKAQIGRLNFPIDAVDVFESARESGFAELPVFSSAAARVRHLPMYHRDPFDRLLIAQAISEPATLFTADAILAKYSSLVTVLADVHKPQPP
jgi:PIN domain nuclease of toxin-antitoxin system